jgi:hypothetical protein
MASEQRAGLIERRTILKTIGAGTMAFLVGGSSAEGQDAGAVFELRVYHAADGKLPALLARFRDHTDGLFRRHGITSVAFWTPTDEPLQGNTLIYILKYPSRAEATKRWKSFQDDPEWVRVKAESEASGKLVEKIDSTFLQLTDFSKSV